MEKTSKRFLSSANTLIGLGFIGVGSLLAFSSFAAKPTPAADSGSTAQSALGQWTIVPSPNASAGENYLGTVTCTGASDCRAAGFYYDATNLVKTLIEHRTPAGWTVEQVPMAVNDRQDLLTALTCVSATNCSGVGYFDNNRLVAADTVDTLGDHFDGTSWSSVAAANGPTPTTDSRLWSVSCPGSNNCWAVGNYLAPGVFSLTPSSVNQTLIEQNTGTGWTLVTSPNVTIPVGRSDPTGQADNVLLAISCSSASDCWAVGWYYNAVGIQQPLTEHYDGSAWSIVSNPTIGYSALEGVTCNSANDCWAVGFILVENPAGNGVVAQSLIEHYDGSAWSIVTSPNTSNAQDNRIFGVTCTSASNCWTVGYYSDATTPDRTLIEHYDGVAWSIVSSPNTSDSDSDYLASISCSSANDCWAVGGYADSVTGYTLVLHYAAPVQLNSVVSRMTHGSVGTFDVDLTSGNGIECRSGGASGNYTLVFTFANTLSSVAGASVTSVAGSVASSNRDSNDAHNYIVNLTGVTSAQHITVTLSNVIDSAGNFSSAISASMGVLVGAVNATGGVDGNDVAAVQAHTRQAVNSNAMARFDVNTTGNIDGNDVALTQAQTRTSLP